LYQSNTTVYVYSRQSSVKTQLHNKMICISQTQQCMFIQDKVQSKHNYTIKLFVSVKHNSVLLIHKRAHLGPRVSTLTESSSGSLRYRSRN